jgi:hypothetical protein
MRSWWPPAYSGTLRQVLGPGQLLQHLDGGDDVVVDDVAFLLRQRAGADGQVLELRRR